MKKVLKKLVTTILSVSTSIVIVCSVNITMFNLPITVRDSWVMAIHQYWEINDVYIVEEKNNSFVLWWKSIQFELFFDDAFLKIASGDGEQYIPVDEINVPKLCNGPAKLAYKPHGFTLTFPQIATVSGVGKDYTIKIHSCFEK